MKWTDNKQVRWLFFFILGAGLLTGCLLLSIVQGSVPVGLSDIVDCFRRPETVNKVSRNIILKIRLPRTLAAAAGGSALAVSGLLLQIFFNNPVVEPYILGISSGANLFLGFVLLGGYSLGLKTISSFTLFLGAFTGAILVMCLVLLASVKVRSITTLLIIGMMMGYLCNAVTSVMMAWADKEKIAGFTLRTMGSFAGFTWQSVQILYGITIFCLVLAFGMSKSLNMMLLGEQYAQSMGVAIRSFRILIILIASLLTAVVTAFAGAVSFVGLAVPHMVRLLFKTSDNRLILPAAGLYGAIMTTLCDLGARTLTAPGELPIGALTAVIGVPVVIWLLLQGRGGGC